MPAIQQKITRYVKRRENVTQNQKEEKKIEVKPEIEHTIELVYKDIKTSCYNCIPYVQEVRGKMEHVKYRHRRYK